MSRRALAAGTAVLAAGALIAGGATASATHSKSGKSGKSAATERQYQITVENLTDGQPISPPFIAAHTRRADYWSTGTIANHAVAAIAEDANNGPAIELGELIPQVKTAVTGVEDGATGPAPIGPKASQTYTVTVNGYAGRLTLLAMLVNTNDAFTGLDSLRLPRRVGHSRTRYRVAYDAGSEKNNESAKYIPGPVGGNPFVRDPEGNVIREHPGVKGGADLNPEDHSVDGKVAKITVKRVK